MRFTWENLGENGKITRFRIYIDINKLDQDCLDASETLLVLYFDNNKNGKNYTKNILLTDLGT